MIMIMILTIIMMIIINHRFVLGVGTYLALALRFLLITSSRESEA